MKAIGYITVTIIAILINSILGGYVLSVLWDWFIVNKFNLPILDVPSAIGISLIVSFLTHVNRNKPESEKKDYLESLLDGFVDGISKSLIALFIGWIVALFI